MSKGSELDKAMWSEASHHVSRFFKDVTADPCPRITLSERLYFRIYPDKAVLVSLGDLDSSTFNFSLDALRAVLRAIHLAGTSEEIQTVDIEGVKVKIDGRRRASQRPFGKLLDWIWKPAPVASTAEPPKYMRISISESGSFVSDYIERRQLELFNLNPPS